MKSLAIFVFSCISLYMVVSCSEKNSFLKKEKDTPLQMKNLNLFREVKSLPNLSSENKLRAESPIDDAMDKLSNFTKLYNNVSDEIPEDKVYKGNCFMKMHNWFYDLYPIINKNDTMKIKSKDGKFIDFNLCHNVKTSCTDKKGLVVDKEQCTLYAGKKSHDKTWNLTENHKTNETRIKLTLPTGSECKQGGNHSVIVDLLCDPSARESYITNEGEFDSNSCLNTIKMVSKYACRTVKFSAWYKSLGVDKLVIGSILGVFGLFLVFFGNTYFKFCSSIIIAFCSAVILKSFLAPFVQMTFPVALCIGIVIAVILYSLMSLVTTVLSIIIGYFLGNIVYNFIVTKFTSIDPDTLFIITILVCIGLTMLLAFLIKEIIVIIATSLVGAYTAVRGLSICLGGFPDESYTSKLIIYREFNQLGRAFGGKANMYLIGILLLFLLGLIIQGGVAIFSGDKKEESKPQEAKKEEETEKLINKEGETPKDP